jgi:ELWxxDGT repeat protein
LRALVPVLLSLALLPVEAAFSAPRLLKDLNPGPEPDGGAYLSFLQPAAQDGLFYFVASDPAHGLEVWRTDGTAAGTYRLTDVCPGSCGSNPTSFALFRGQLYFQADDGSSGLELWRTDGTPGGERRVRDLCPGPCGSVLNYEILTSRTDALYFLSQEPRGVTLWRTSGSRRSTVPVARLCEDPIAGGSCFASWINAVGGRLLVQVTGTAGDTQLWASDGTAAGTRPLLAPNGEPVAAYALLANGGFAFLETADGLWRTDGTMAGTFRLLAWSDLPTPPPGQVYPWRTLWRGSYYGSFGGGVLVVSDGTATGTRQVPGFPDIGYVASFTTTPDGIVFSTYDGVLWRTRGEPETTEVLLDPAAFGFDQVFLLPPAGDRVLFSVYRSATESSEIWTTDGTPAGTRRVQELESGTAAAVSAGDRVYFIEGDSGIGAYHQLWTTDGTPEGTRLVRDFGDLPASSGPFDQAALGGAVIFSARTEEHEVPLFRTDGTRGGTRLLSAEATRAQRFTLAGGRLFFATADDEVYPGTSYWYVRPSGVWSTDGTAAGTTPSSRQVVTWNPVGPLGDAGGAVLFGGADSIPRYYGGPDVEPWLARPGSAGRVKDLYRFAVETGHHHICVPGGSHPGPGVAVGGVLLFAADDGRSGRELWASDGTAAGTRLVADINPLHSPDPPEPDCDYRAETPLGSDPRELVSLPGGAIFTADDGVHGREIWRTNGTPAGTRLIANLVPGADSAAPHDLVAWRNRVYFFAALPGGGEGLWRTDGTARGTVLVHALMLAGLPSWGTRLTVAGDRLFFAVYNESTGTELWTSRGDAASTRLVADLRPGAPGSFPQALTAAGTGRVVLAADDGQTGQEPWISDGTAAGTARLGDINPGRDASAPGPFTLGTRFALTGAWEPAHGREPWAIPLP